MAMVNLQMSPEEAREMGMCAESTPDGDLPRYPYGTKICLDDDSVEKLGITKLPAVGATMMLMARVTVVGVRSGQNQGGDAENYVDLQITDAEIKPTQRSQSELASAMYPNQE
jgi:hypothetical protein